MALSLRLTSSERLDHLSWLDGHTRSAIRKKVGRTSELFGYPDFIFNSSELDRVYGDLHVTEDEYLENQVQIIESWRRALREMVTILGS